MSRLTGALRRVGLVAAIPFLAGVASDTVTVETTVHHSGSAFRRVSAVADSTRIKPIQTDLRLAYPDWKSWRQGDTFLGADKAFARCYEIPDANLRITGGLLSLTRDYEFEEKITVSDSLSTTRDANIRAQAPIEYKVTMPVPVVDAPGAEISGRTATFTLTLADNDKTITVKAHGVDADRVVFLVFVLFAALVGVLNLVIPSRERREAAKAAQPPAEVPEATELE